jgi:3-methyl-2-oxobutanoate hydroxymethyltransferase
MTIQNTRVRNRFQFTPGNSSRFASSPMGLRNCVRTVAAALTGSILLITLCGMLRPRQKYSVYDLQQLKGKRCLTHVHVKSSEEAAAAEAAGIDLMSCSFDSPEAQARLPLLVAAAPTSFFSTATPHGMASQDEAIRIAFRALELGASSVYCSASPWIIEAMAREGIPVVGHLGMVPRHATWTNFRAIGKTEDEAKGLYAQMKRLESAGAYAAEIELVPHALASYLCKNTSMLLMSLGSGTGCDTQFLFSDDILGDYDERLPRHAKAYRNFLAEYKRLQDERIAAFNEYAADVTSERFPEAGHLIQMDADTLRQAIEAIEAIETGQAG